MTVLVFVPLALSVIGTGFFLRFTDLEWKWKGLAIALTGTSIVLQFALKEVPLAIPLVLQAVMCLWVIFYWKLEYR